MRRCLLLTIVFCPLIFGSSCQTVTPPPVDQGSLTDPQPAGGKVQVPAGFSLALDTLRIVTNAGEVPVAADGSFQAQVISNLPSLVRVVDATDRVLLLGFLSPSTSSDQQIGTASTAVVLLFFGLEGWTAPAAALNDIIADINSAPESGPLTAALNTALTANAAALHEGDPGIVTALDTAVAQLSGASSTAKRINSVVGAGPHTRTHIAQAGGTPFLTIDPHIHQSGLIVQATETGDGVLIINESPRPVVAYAFQVGYEDTNGAHVDLPLPEQIAGPINLIGASNFQPKAKIRQEVSLEEIWKTTVSDPIPLPLRQGSSKTNYKLVAVGPAANQTAEAAPFSDPKFVLQREDWRARVKDLGNQYFVFQFIVPLVEYLAIGSRIGLTDVDDSATVVALEQAIIGPVEAAGISLKTSEGYRDAFKLILDKLAHEDGFAAGLIDTLLNNYDARTATHLLRPNLTKNVQNMSRNAEIRAAVEDPLRRNSISFGALHGSHEAELWTVDIGRVSILPSEATVSPGLPTAEFTASVFGGGEGLSYKWTTTGSRGVIQSDIDAAALTFTSTASAVQYIASPGAISDGELDRITVEVSDANGNFIGAAGARVIGSVENPPCAGFSDDTYNQSEVLILEIAPHSLRPGEPMQATVSYNFGHPLAETSSTTVTVYCSAVCGFCDLGQECFCTSAEENGVLMDDEPAPNVSSSPLATGLASTHDRPGLQIGCYASSEANFFKPKEGGVVKKTFIFPINPYWTPCPGTDPDCTCPVFHAGNSFNSPSYTGLFVIASASRLQEDSPIKATDFVARSFQFGVGDQNSGGCD